MQGEKGTRVEVADVVFFCVFLKRDGVGWLANDRKEKKKEKVEGERCCRRGQQ